MDEETIIKDVLMIIARYREARGWSEYQLAEQSGIPQSTISTWYRKTTVPSTASLIKICNTLGITVSQLFAEAESNDLVALTPAQKELLRRWANLDQKQQMALFTLLDSI